MFVLSRSVHASRSVATAAAFVLVLLLVLVDRCRAFTLQHRCSPRDLLVIIIIFCKETKSHWNKLCGVD